MQLEEFIGAVCFGAGHLFEIEDELSLDLVELFLQFAALARRHQL